MKTDSDLDRQLHRLLREGLNHELGPDPTWAESPAARRVAERERRARYRWPLRILAVAALIGAVGGAALLSGGPPDLSNLAPNGWIAFTVADGPDDDHDIWLVALDQEARRVIGTDTDAIQQLCPAFSPDGRSLAYGQPGALVVADVSGDGRVSDRLTVDVAGTPCPVWSPDGGQVAFGVNRTSPVNPATSAAGSEVWIVTLADGGITALPDLLATDLEWSPDGSFLAIASGVDEIVPGNRLHDGRISLYAPSSGALRQLDATLGATELTWSPDSRLIAYMAIADMTGDSFHELRIIDVETERQRVVVEGFAAVHGIGPVWSPDGESIVYQRSPSGGESHEVVLLTPGDPADEAATPGEVVVPMSYMTAEDPERHLLPFWVTWSPDGEYLLSMSWTQIGDRLPVLLVAIPTDPSKPAVVLTDLENMSVYGYPDTTFVPIQTWGRRPSNDSSKPSAAASVPPDSSAAQLAYELDGDIYLADADGNNAVRITEGEPFGEEGECSSSGGEGPMWSPDGRYLAYRSNRNDGCSGSVYLSDADGHPVASFPGTGWDVSWAPDSTRVATWLELWETVGIYGIDGDRQALLSAPPGCVGPGDHDPLWSPDGQSVVAAGCEMPIDGQTPRRLSDDDPRSREGVYSPDGTRVAYATYTEGVYIRTASLVIAEASGTELQVLTYQSDWRDPTGEVVFFNNIVWSPLGDRVAFAWRSMDNSGSLVTSELRVLDISSGDETTIAAEGGIWGPLAYSPGGDRILYATRSANWDPTGLWSISADGSDKQLLVPGSAWGDWQPLPPGS